MSAGLDFQEAFLLMFSYPIMLILGVTLAAGILSALVQAAMLEPREERAPEISDE